MARFECGVCGYIYDEEHASRKFDELSECPICGTPKSSFKTPESNQEESSTPVFKIGNDSEEEPADKESEFVVEKRQEFWSPLGSKTETKNSETPKPTWTISGMGTVQKVIDTDNISEEVREPAPEIIPEKKSDSPIQTFYSDGNSVKSPEEIEREKEQNEPKDSFRPLWGTGTGTIQTVITPGEKKTEEPKEDDDTSDDDFVFEEVGKNDNEESAAFHEISSGEREIEPADVVSVESLFEETFFNDSEDEEEIDGVSEFVEILEEEKNNGDSKDSISEEESVVEEVHFGSDDADSENIPEAMEDDLADEESFVFEDATNEETAESEEEFVFEPAVDNEEPESYVSKDLEEPESEIAESSESEEDFVFDNESFEQVFEEENDDAVENVDEIKEEVSFDDVTEGVAASEAETVSDNEEQEDSFDAFATAAAAATAAEIFAANEAENDVESAETAEFEASENEDAEIEAVETETVEAEVAETETVETEHAEAEIAETETAEAETAETEITEAETAETEITEEETVETETAETENAESEEFTQSEEYFGAINSAETDETSVNVSDEEEECVQVPVAYSMLKGSMKYSVLYDEQAKKIFDNFPVMEERVSNGLENIILMPAQLNPLPLPGNTEVETRTVIGALTACPVEVRQPFCFSKLFLWGEHIPNNDEPEEYNNQAFVLVKGKNGHIPEVSSREDLKEEVAIAKERFHGTPVGVDLVAGRIESDLASCVYAKVDFVILNDLSSRILPYALRRAKNFLNKVNAKIDILVCVDALKDAQELAKIIALGADFVLVERGFDLDMASRITDDLKEIARSTGHDNVHDINMNDICTVDSDIAMYTDIAHI